MTMPAAPRQNDAVSVPVEVDRSSPIPLYFQVNTWAMRQGVTYEARTDEMTLAFSAGRNP